MKNEFWAIMNKKGEFHQGYLAAGGKESVEGDYFGESYRKNPFNPEGWHGVKVKLMKVNK